MSGNPNAVAAAVPCKITPVAGAPGTVQVNAGDLPVPITIESQPASCQFKIAAIEIFDSGNNAVDSNQAVNATTANLPPTSGKALAPGTYVVIIRVSPAATFAGGNDPFNGGTARIFENCRDKTLLFVADANFPVPQFLLQVN